jgi:hypothetical protein
MLAKGSSVGGMEGFAAALATGVIGSAEEIKSSVSKLFPSLQWRESEVSVAEHGKARVWIGLQGPPEFRFRVEPDGLVRVLTMSYCQRSEVKRVAKELGLVAFDEQSMEVFDG